MFRALFNYRSRWIVMLILAVGLCVYVAYETRPLTRPPGLACLRDASVVSDKPDLPYSLPNGDYVVGVPIGSAHDAKSPALDGLKRLVAERRGAAGESGKPGGPIEVNILVLSGGAQWGAYGSGFLNGLYGGNPQPPKASDTSDPRLADYDVITGVSTGAMMAPYVWSAALRDRVGDRSGASKALGRLQKSFDSSTDQLFKDRNPLLALLGSNALKDPTQLQDKSVASQAVDLSKVLNRDDKTAVLVGAVNLRDGKFYAFDLGQELREPKPRNVQCLTETLLASSAIPFVLPPRYIDGQPFVDGGVRFQAFVSNLLIDLRRLDTSIGDPASRGNNLRINIRVVINGNLSPNDPVALGAAQAAACDQADNPAQSGHCADVANSLIGDFPGGVGSKGLLQRVTQDVMINQINIDSIYKIYHDWRDLGLPGSFKYTYLSNKDLALPPRGANIDPACEHPSTKSGFDKTFQSCLWRIGVAKGRARQWSFAAEQTVSLGN